MLVGAPGREVVDERLIDLVVEELRCDAEAVERLVNADETIEVEQEILCLEGSQLGQLAQAVEGGDVVIDFGEILARDGLKVAQDEIDVERGLREMLFPECEFFAAHAGGFAGLGAVGVGGSVETGGRGGSSGGGRHDSAPGEI